MRLPLVCCFLLLGCTVKHPSSTRASPTPQPSPTPLSLAGELKKPVSVLFDKVGTGRRLLEVEGGTVELQTGSRPVGIRGTRATLYQDGKPALVVSAPSVFYDSKKKVLRAEGGVEGHVLSRADQRRFQCDTLTWQPSARAVRGEGHVLAQYGALAQVSGSRVDADLQLNTLEVLP